MKLVIVTATGLALAGCLQEARPNPSTLLAQSIIDGRVACEAAKHANRVARARCFNQAEARMGELVDADLVNVRFATRLVLAEKIDKREITEAEAELQFARTNSDLSSQLSSRSTSRQIARAQTLSAISAVQASEPTTCTRIGNSVTCF